MFNLEKQGNPSTEAVTVAEIKAHCRISHTADDSYIDTLRVAAREQVEADLGIAIASQDYRLYFEQGFADIIVLPIQPVSEITSITYTDADDNEQTLNAAKYTLKAYKDPPEIEFEDDLPNGTDVTVNFVAGYPAEVPSLIKRAVLFLAAAWYENREGASDANVKEIPLAYQRIIQRLRVSRYR